MQLNLPTPEPAKPARTCCFTGHRRIPEAHIEALGALRDTLPFDIDGAVVKIDTLSHRAILGEGTNTPNVGFIRYRAFMKEIGVKNENIYVTLGDIDSFPLPMPIY